LWVAASQAAEKSPYFVISESACVNAKSY